MHVAPVATSSRLAPRRSRGHTGAAPEPESLLLTTVLTTAAPPTSGSPSGGSGSSPATSPFAAADAGGDSFACDSGPQLLDSDAPLGALAVPMPSVVPLQAHHLRRHARAGSGSAATPPGAASATYCVSTSSGSSALRHGSYSRAHATATATTMSGSVASFYDSGALSVALSQSTVAGEATPLTLGGGGRPPAAAGAAGSAIMMLAPMPADDACTSSPRWCAAGVGSRYGSVGNAPASFVAGGGGAGNHGGNAYGTSTGPSSFASTTTRTVVHSPAASTAAQQQGAGGGDGNPWRAHVQQQMAQRLSGGSGVPQPLVLPAAVAAATPASTPSPSTPPELLGPSHRLGSGGHHAHSAGGALLGLPTVHSGKATPSAVSSTFSTASASDAHAAPPGGKALPDEGLLSGGATASPYLDAAQRSASAAPARQLSAAELAAMGGLAPADGESCCSEAATPTSCSTAAAAAAPALGRAASAVSEGASSSGAASSSAAALAGVGADDVALRIRAALTQAFVRVRHAAGGR